MFLNRKREYYKTNISIYIIYNEISIFKGDDAINITNKLFLRTQKIYASLRSDD